MKNSVVKILAVCSLIGGTAFGANEQEPAKQAPRRLSAIGREIEKIDADMLSIAVTRDNAMNSRRCGGGIPVDPYIIGSSELMVYDSQLAALSIKRKTLVAEQVSVQQENKQKQGE